MGLEGVFNNVGTKERTGAGRRVLLDADDSVYTEYDGTGGVAYALFFHGETGGDEPVAQGRLLLDRAEVEASRTLIANLILSRSREAEADYFSGAILKGSLVKLLDEGDEFDLTTISDFLLKGRAERSGASNRIKDAQEAICTAFGLNMAQFAELLGVSRSTPYNWRRNPRSLKRKDAERLFALQRVAKDWVLAGFPQPGPYMYEKVYQEKSLFEYLKDPKPDAELIEHLGSKLLFSSGDKDELY